MNLEDQIQVLIDRAPQDGTTPKVIRAIAPALSAIASQLQHPQYYVLQAVGGNWIVTTLSHRLSNVEKSVVYAFAGQADALASSFVPPSQPVTAIALPTTHILFQMVAMKNIDSVVFFEAIGSPADGTEVSRQNLNHLIEQCLQQYKNAAIVPPDLA